MSGCPRTYLLLFLLDSSGFIALQFHSIFFVEMLWHCTLLMCCLCCDELGSCLIPCCRAALILLLHDSMLYLLENTNLTVMYLSTVEVARLDVILLYCL